MPSPPRFRWNRDAAAVLFLAVWPFVYFWPVTLGQAVWFTTDIIRLFYPFSVELSRSLAAGHLPLWTPGILGGFPLLAEGQVGALYPVNLVLFRLVPVHLALSYAILLHLAWAATGMYVLARCLGSGSGGALLAGLVFSFSSFVFGHLSHSAVIATFSWLPWLLFFQQRFQQAWIENRGKSASWFLLTIAAFGIQLLPGSAQIAFLNSLAFLFLGILGGFFWNRPRQAAGRGAPASLFAALTSVVLSTGIPVMLGAGIAAAQLLPTAELVQYSVRSETSTGFFTSYSLPPAFLTFFIWPFGQGEPAEATGEFWTYFGLIPLVFVLLAPLLRRDQRTIAFLILGTAALALSLGESNPVYALLHRLPLFGLFRVPARYLHLVTLAAAVLSAVGFEAIADRQQPASGSHERRIAVAVILAILVGSSIWLGTSQSLDFWLGVWRVWPLVLAGVLAAALFATGKRRIAAGTFTILVLGLTILDLANYAPPFLATIDALTPASYVGAVPRSIAALGTPESPTRVFTDLSVFPSVPALRASLFPNTALIYGWESAMAYTSLAFARHEAYMTGISPGMLNLLNVRFVMIPLEPRPQTGSTAPSSAWSVDVENEIAIPPIAARRIRVTSFTEEASDLPFGTAVADIAVHYGDGTSQDLPLRTGIETADWDYERKSTPGAAEFAGLSTAHSFPGFWRSFGRAFAGHTFAASYELPAAKPVTGLKVEPVLKRARFTVESIVLEDEEGKAISLAALSGKDEFSLAFLSDTVAVWENKNVLPRALMVHSAEVLDDAAALERLQSTGFRPEEQVLLAEGRVTPTDVKSFGVGQDTVAITKYEADRVALEVSTDRPGYLVLADSWYPGWEALVDGRPVPVSRADLIFRAVPIAKGQHTVVFEYRSMPFLIGLLVGAISLLAAGALAALIGRFSR